MPYPGELSNTPLEQTERFDRVLQYLQGKGGLHQQRMEAWAAELGMAVGQLAKIIKRAEEHHLIRVNTNGHPVVGVGRFPNTYKLLVDPQDWVDRRDDYLAGITERRREVEASKRMERERIERDEARKRRLARERKALLEKLAGAKEDAPQVVPAPDVDLILAARLSDPVFEVMAWSESHDFD